MADLIFYNHGLTGTTIWIIDYIDSFLWDIITHPCPNFSTDLTIRIFRSGQNLHDIFHHTFCVHDDVIKWKHFPRYWPFVRGIHRSRLFSLIFAWTNGGVNNGDAGDLRRHAGHYDVTVMTHKYIPPLFLERVFRCSHKLPKHSLCFLMTFQWYTIRNILTSTTRQFWWYISWCY